MPTQFANDVKRLLHLETRVRDAMPAECAKLMTEIIEQSGGLRLAARKLGVSPSYVHQVSKGHSVLSLARYLELWKATR